MIYDYLIVGQGLAGSILAYQLHKRNKTVVIVDDQKPNTSSKVAAGLVNPLTGPKMIKSWKAEILFPFLMDFYKQLESELGGIFFREATIYRPFSSAEIINDLEGKSSNPTHAMFIKNVPKAGKHTQFVNDPLGGVELMGAVLKVSVFIKSMKEYLSERCVYMHDCFDENEMEIKEHLIRWKSIEVRKVLFCTGYLIQQSKLFGWLPMAPVKGEILQLKLKENFKTIYNKSGFIIPQGDSLFKAGSTYDREDLTEKSTEKGKFEICQKLDALIKMKYEVVQHEAGIRPGTIPRRPLMGFHPEFPNIGVFNGLGTKGVSIAPYFSDQFVKCLEEGNNLDQEVDIKKYYSLYFNSHFSEKI